MKIIHTSDIHLASPLTSKLSYAKARIRVRELDETFARMCAEGARVGAEAFIIAGDLFDCARVSQKSIDTLLAIIERYPQICFLYLPGNHEEDVLLQSGGTLPQNLKIFGESWCSYSVGDVNFIGRSKTERCMFDSLPAESKKKNIVVLHGEARDRSAEGGFIGISEAAGRGIDYIALGHYHAYSVMGVDSRTVAVYSGTPEGRGFDEVGERGFVLIDTDSGRLTHRFIPFCKRQLKIIDTDISGLVRTAQVERLIAQAVDGEPRENLIRIRLVGNRELDLRCDTGIITQSFSEKFFYFEIKDESRLTTRAEDYRFDKSLKGEFIRLCLEDPTLTDEEKSKVIHCGLSALANEAFDE